MSIQAFTKDPILASILCLEAKRRGFCEDGEPSILFVDLDTAQPPSATADVPIVALSKDPACLTAHQHDGFFALLSLPFSAKDFGDILHRYGTKSQTATLRRAENCVWLNGQRIALSATEGALFDLLYRHRNRTVTEAELNAVLGDSTTRTNTVAVYLYRLRRKLCADGVTRIKTVRGQGYRWIGS